MPFVPPPPPPRLSAPGRLPTESAALKAQIDALKTQRGALPGLFNPQRLTLAANSSRSLTDAGLFERSAPVQATRAKDGTVSYRLNNQFEGQAFRDARQGIAGNAAARGAGFSSNARRRQRQARRGLTNQAQGVERSFAQQQADLVRQQAQQFTSLGGQLGQARGAAADFTANAAFQNAENQRQNQNAQAQLDFSHTTNTDSLRRQFEAQQRAENEARMQQALNRSGR